MNASKIGLSLLAGATMVFWSAMTLNADPSRVPQKGTDKGQGGTAEKAEGVRPLSLAEARERAKLMHEIHSATLEAMHHHFFRGDRAVIPARAMEDVFAELDRQTGIKTRWIAVNTPAMSIDHKPKSEFEKDAAAVLSRGHTSYDKVVKGTYHRASAIPLGPGCLGCHTRLGLPPSKIPRVAGLVISIPVQDD